jgi:uroporphyrinogen-III decarboxylase
MTSLTPLERVLRTVAGEPVDRMPVFAPLSWHTLLYKPAAGDWKNAPAYRRLVSLALACSDPYVQLEIPERTPFRNAGQGYGMGGVPEGIFDRRFLLVPPDCIEKLGETALQGRRVEQYAIHTPRGVLTTSEAVLPGEDTVWELEPLVKSPEDAEKLLALPARFDPPDLDEYLAQVAGLAATAVPVIFISSPIVMISRLTGFQRFLEWTITEPGLVQRLMTAAQERVAERLAYILARGAGPIFRFGGCEQATPPMMSGRGFDRYVLGYERPLWQLVRDAGRIVWVHCHGRVGTVIDKFVDAGAQMLDPVEPPPQGDITLADARRRAAAGPITLIGNIEWSDLELRTPNEIEALVRQAVDEGGPDHLVLGASAEVFTAPSERVCANVEAFLEAAAAYGRA